MHQPLKIPSPSEGEGEGDADRLIVTCVMQLPSNSEHARLEPGHQMTPDSNGRCSRAHDVRVFPAAPPSARSGVGTLHHGNAPARGGTRLPHRRRGKGKIQPDTELDLLLIQETAEPFHRRSDFWVTHLRPSVGTRFLVYTPQEFEELAGSDPLLVETQAYGEVLFDDG